jgi:hypothetical protein
LGAYRERPPWLNHAPSNPSPSTFAPKAISVAHGTGGFAILPHTLSEPVKRFYLSRGFVGSPSQPMTLMMTLPAVRAILAEPG